MLEHREGFRLEYANFSTRVRISVKETIPKGSTIYRLLGLKNQREVATVRKDSSVSDSIAQD